MKKIFSVLLACISFCWIFPASAAAEFLNASAEESVAADIDALSDDMLLSVPLTDDGYLLDPLVLDEISKGENGSEITWSSSAPEIIAENGAITLPEKETRVVVTAKAVLGNAEKTKQFEFLVAGKRTDIEGLPLWREKIMSDDFSDSVQGAYIETTNLDSGSDFVSEERGRIRLERRAWVSGKEPAVRFYFDDNKTPLSGEFLQELTLTRTSDIVRLRFGINEQWQYFTQIYWEGNNFIISYRDENLKTASKTLDMTGMKTAKISLLSNYTSGTPMFSMWINNKLALSNVFCVQDVNPKNAKWMQFYTVSYGNFSGVGEITADNYGVYRLTEAPVSGDDEELLQKDFDLLTEESILSAPKADGFLIDNLDTDIVTSGRYGSLISWTSSDEDTISPLGKVTRSEEDKEVTLMAHLTRGEYSLEKKFEFTVASRMREFEGMTGNRFPEFFDDFSDGKLDGRIKTDRFTSDGDSFSEDNGKLTVTRNKWATSEPCLQFYFNSDMDTRSDKFIQEMTLSRTNDTTRIRFGNNANWNYVSQLSWHGNTLSMDYRDENLQVASKSLDMTGQNKLKVTVLMDIDAPTPTFSVWLNNRLFLENVYSRYNLSPKNVKWTQVYLVSFGDFSGTGSVSVDNYGVYKIMPDMSDEERCISDSEALKYESLLSGISVLEGTISDDLILPQYGENGSRIYWTSSDTGVIENDGRVIRDPYENKSCIMTAEFVSGSVRKTKQFEFTVLSLQVEIGDVPTVREMIVQNDFSGEESENLIVTNESGGGKVYIKDGALCIDKTGDGSAQVSATIYSGADKNASAAGVIGLEFDVEREKSSSVQIRSLDAAGNLYYSFAWGSDVISAYYSNTAGVTGTSSKVWGGKANKLHFNMMFDCSRSTYSMWVDGQLVIHDKYSRIVGTSAISYTMFYLESKNSIKIRDYKLYHAIPPKAERLSYDLRAFSVNDILTKPFVGGNIIDSDLKLPEILPYGTEITWSSSDEEVINPISGAVTRPRNAAKNPKVTLTAEFENSGLSKTLTYDFTVLRDFDDAEEKAKAEADDITLDILTSENPNEITMALKPLKKGFYGSDITWESSDKSVIWNSGHVVRPRWDESAKEVTLTATVGGRFKKSFEFTVLPDEKPKDPGYITDEEFFGKWSGTEWTKGGKFDYTLPGLGAVEAAAKAGDYESAKKELLSYIQGREEKTSLGLMQRYTGWSNMWADGVQDISEACAYYKGDISVTGDSFEAVYSNIYNPNAITKGGVKAFEIIAKYNEDNAALIAGHDYENENMRPVLELTVNGEVKYFPACDSATVRAGSYSKKHYDGGGILKAKTFGEFLSDETYRVLLKFDLSALSSKDTITNGRLRLYAKKDTPFVDSSELLLVNTLSSSWEGSKVVWDGLSFVVHNYNGIPGGYAWGSEKSSNIEYAYQTVRFMQTRTVIAEYLYTNNEKYAYALLSNIADFIKDSGTATPYPRLLDAALRMQQWIVVLKYLKNNKYMDSELCTMFLKNMWSNIDFYSRNISATSNWLDYAYLAEFYASQAFPEFKVSSEGVKTSTNHFTEGIKKSFLQDGSYIEATNGYSNSVLSMHRDFKKAAYSMGISLPEEYDERLRKAVYGIVLMYGSGGSTLQYGDEGFGTRSTNGYGQFVEWFDDYELQYIDSQGQKGTEPSWTSHLFENSAYTVLRSGWEKDDTVLFTNVRGGDGGHGHADDNEIVLSAFGKRLLVDSGKFNYDAYSEVRQYALSTRAHNTVLINNTSQRNGWLSPSTECVGTVHSFVADKNYDFVSQSTKSNASSGHKRSILFIKDGPIVVSDYMTPNDKKSENSFKQLWHMTPEANMSIENESGVIRSNFEDGKNIIVASGDRDAASYAEDGFYDMGNDVRVKYGLFERKSKGNTIMNTVLLPTDYKDAALSAQTLESPEDVAALSFEVKGKNGTKKYIYAQDNRAITGVLNIDGLKTDAEILLLGRDEKGRITDLAMIGGSYVTKDGEDIVSCGKKTDNVSVFSNGADVNISSYESNFTASNFKINLANPNVKNVFVNGESTQYSLDKNNFLSVGSGRKEEKQENDKNSDKGIGGSGSGGNEPQPTVSPQPTQTPDTAFKDIKDHWAEKYIESMAKRGIINGVGDGLFEPDRAITRAEVITIAAKTAGIREENYKGGFSDVSENDWFAKNVQAMLSAGLIAKDSVFRPNDGITREEFAKIISGTADYMKLQKGEEKNIEYSDESLISGWAKPFVYDVTNRALMLGNEKGEFMPKNGATRAEAATVFYRFLNGNTEN